MSKIFPDIREEHYDYEDGIELFKKYYESGAEECKIINIIENIKSHKYNYIREFENENKYVVKCELCKHEAVHSRNLDNIKIDKALFEEIYSRFSISCKEIIKKDIYKKLKDIFLYYDNFNKQELCKIIQEETLKIPDLLTIEDIIK